MPAHVAGCGLPFTYLAVRPGAVDRAVPDHAALDGLGVGEGISVLSWDAATSTAYARVFAGDLPWGEDPATGSAALGTGVWLVATGLLPGDGTSSYVVRQGEKMGRPSVLACTVTASGGRAVRRPSAAPSCRSRAAASGSRRDRRARADPGLGAAPPGRPRRRADLARRRRRLAVGAADRAGGRAGAGDRVLAQRRRRRRRCCRCCSPGSGRPCTGLRLRDLRSSVVAGLFLAAHFAAWLPSLSMTTVARVRRAGHHHPDLDGAGRADLGRAAAGRGLVGAGARRRRGRR